MPTSPLEALVELKKINLPNLSFIILLIRCFVNKMLENEFILNTFSISLEFKFNINLSIEIVAKLIKVIFLSIFVFI